jgi:hypothetical protein
MMDEVKLAKKLKAIPGGYAYLGACSVQICFPLKAGGELRFMWVDDDHDTEPIGEMKVDLYSGATDPCVTGSSAPTGVD